MIEQLKVQWYSYIKLAIIYAMVFQISFVFDFIWYDRTYTMLAYMLMISFFTHLFLIRMNKILTFFLEYLVAFLVCLIFSEKWELYAGQSMYTLYDKLQLTITDSWQFYTIGLIMLTLAHFIHYAIVSRAHFTTFFAVGLLLMLIVDSFSPIVLWQHVIAVVVVYLLWHMFWHYEKIRKENEDEFEVLINSPASIFTPVATVVSIAIVIALVMPYGPPLLEDPYALWKKSRGEEVPAFLGDKGFKSDRANVRSRQSGYSRSSTHLGGGFNFNYETVLEIFTPQKSYWRGETVNYYNGEGWIDTLQQDSFSEIGPKASFEQHRPLAQTEQIDIEVKLIREAPYPVLFHPSEPIMVNEVAYDLIDSSLAQLDSSHRYIEGPDQKIEQVIYDENINLPGVKRLEKDNTLAFDMNQAASSYPVAYSIKADVIKLEVDKLVQADAKLEDAALHELYTTLPNTLPQEVTELAALITSQASSDYERAKLLEEYLKLNYAYSNQPNEERLTGQVDDFVYQFLFELYEGYCDYFSTAMAVMAKSLDMPARWVKGFSPGVNLSEQYLQQIQMPYDNYEQLQNSLNGGIFNVRNADAHSWVEIYFEGYGWIAFEPTPGFSYPYAYAGDDIQLTPLAHDLDLDVDQQVISTKKQTAFNSLRLALIIFIIIGLAVLVWIKKDSIRDTIVSLRYKRFSNNERIVYQFTAFLRYCERRGLHREKTETVHEAILSWQHGSKVWKQQLSDCYQLFEKAKYSAQQMDDEHVQKVNELIQSLKKQWKL